MTLIGTTLARGLPAGLICGAALWASAGAHAATDLGTELALVARGQADGLPQPLSPADARHYRRIFEAQERGDFDAALRESRALSDPLLLGHVQAQRLLHPRTRASAEELAAWFARYADHPDAVRLHGLLVSRLPRGQAAPAAPAPALLPAVAEAETGPAIDEALQAAARTALERTVRDRARAGDATGALAAINSGRPDPATAAMLRGEVAHALFLLNRDAEALNVARAALKADEGEVFLPAFAGGLAAFRLDRPAEAMAMFTRAHHAAGAQPAQKAAAAFWAARAAVRARRPQLYAPWLAEAAQHPRSFYGLLARRTLGLAPGFAWEQDRLGTAEAALLAETANGLRVLALLQVGQKDRAEAEMRLLAPRAQDNPSLARALLVVANASRMPEMTARLAGLAEGADGRPRDYARFQMPDWRPSSGFRTDPALLLALARVESNFRTKAVSPAGARGPMQIMPRTAAYVTGRPAFAGSESHLLHDPAISLDVGQQYLSYLARHEATGGDLILTLAAYNAGPGSLARWLPSVNHRNDPLLFLEAVPNPETRAHVQRVLGVAWIYASRLNRGSPSLDALAAGRWPSYAAYDSAMAGSPRSGELAEAARPR